MNDIDAEVAEYTKSQRTHAYEERGHTYWDEPEPPDSPDNDAILAEIGALISRARRTLLRGAIPSLFPVSGLKARAKRAAAFYLSGRLLALADKVWRAGGSGPVRISPRDLKASLEDV